MIGKKFDNNKPNLLPYFFNMPFTKKDFSKEKKSDLKIDYEWLDFSLFNFDSLNEISKGLKFGSIQYGIDNYKFVKPYKLRYLKALLRHLFQRFVLNEKYDNKTGLLHLALAGCCLLFLLEKDVKKNKKLL